MRQSSAALAWQWESARGEAVSELPQVPFSDHQNTFGKNKNAIAGILERRNFPDASSGTASGLAQSKIVGTLPCLFIASRRLTPSLATTCAFACLPPGVVFFQTHAPRDSMSCRAGIRQVIASKGENPLTPGIHAALLRAPLQPERWLSGRKQRFAKASYGLNRIEGSNPSLSATFQSGPRESEG
jgi:hypothetical protein